MTVVIVLSSPDYTRESEALAARLGCPLTDTPSPEVDFYLEYSQDRLQLRPSGKNAPGPVFVDFVGGKVAHRLRQGEGRRSPLARAVGMKPGFTPRVLDATAGLGRDAFVLATLGCEVRMVEQSPVVHALLEDGLRRAREAGELADIIGRLSLVQGNALPLLAALPPDEYPDSVYLDPMYPHKGKAALAKKEMQSLQRLLGQDTQGAELLQLARRRARRRVAVKRPARAGFLGGQRPDFQVKGVKTRYDIYLPQA